MLEIVGCVNDVVRLKAEPADVLDNAVDIILIFRLRVCVVEAQLGRTVKVLGDAKVQTDRLRVPDMQIAVRFRWKARLHAAVVFPSVVVSANLLANKVCSCYVITHRFRLRKFSGP